MLDQDLTQEQRGASSQLRLVTIYDCKGAAQFRRWGQEKGCLTCWLCACHKPVGDLTWSAWHWLDEPPVPFAGERIIHSQSGEQGVADFQRRLDKLLSKGAAEGRVHKPIVAVAG